MSRYFYFQTTNDLRKHSMFLQAGKNDRIKKDIFSGRDHISQKFARHGFFISRYFLDRSRRNNSAAAGAAFRPEIDHVIRTLDNVQVMLDHNHGIAHIHQAHQNIQQFLDIGKMQTNGRFVQDIQGIAVHFLAQFPSQFNPLRLSSG